MPLSKIDSDSLSAPLTVPAGSAAAPAITTTGDTNTGIFFPAADTIAFAEGGVEAVRIDSSGNVGIGTSSPSTKLQVNGQTRISDGTTNIDIVCASTVGYIGTQTNAPLVLRTNDTERARIDSSGNLLVGTTTYRGRITSEDTGTNTFSAPMGANVTSSAGAGSCWVFTSVRLGTNVGGIQNTSTATQFITSSDYRLKNTIAPMTGALAKVALLKPVTYKWNVDGSDGQGFIAHELAEVEAGCVTGEKDAVDAEGNPQYQGIDTSFLVATLTAAIQELKAIVDAQGAEIAALKGTP